MLFTSCILTGLYKKSQSGRIRVYWWWSLSNCWIFVQPFLHTYHHRVNIGKTIYLISSYPIREGEEVADIYSMHYSEINRDGRRDWLSKNFHFLCSCKVWSKTISLFSLIPFITGLQSRLANFRQASSQGEAGATTEAGGGWEVHLKCTWQGRPQGSIWPAPKRCQIARIQLYESSQTPSFTQK